MAWGGHGRRDGLGAVAGRVYTPGFTGEQRDLAVVFSRYFLPQILFYGVSATAGAVLNIRGRFAAPMWAPLCNSLIVIAVGLIYLAIGGSTSIASPDDRQPDCCWRSAPPRASSPRSRWWSGPWPAVASRCGPGSTPRGIGDPPYRPARWLGTDARSSPHRCCSRPPPGRRRSAGRAGSARTRTRSRCSRCRSR